MSNSFTVLRREDVPPSGTKATSRLSLPADLLEKGRGRVALVALLCAVIGSIDAGLGLIGWLTASADVRGEGLPVVALGTNAGGVLMALGLYGLARSKRVGHWTVLNAGLGFEVALCLIISIFNPLLTYRSAGLLPNLTWVTPLIIVFPLMIPSPPAYTLATALVAASTAPAGLLVIATYAGVPVGGTAYVGAFVSPALAALLAFFGSRVIYGLGLQVSAERKALAREREMGSYRLEQRLGHGGMGEVWRASHRFLARPAAVKLIRPELMGDDEASRSMALNRFEREAQATASLQSPHTIQIFDFGHTEDRTFFYVMELLDGLTLDALVRRFGPLPPERVIYLIAQACHSLAEAHAKGLAHRDVKPANLFACRLGQDVDFVKVLDFGLVKNVRPRDDAETQLTGGHVAVGTPAYIAPEQVLGDRPVDARTDIYALGAVTYWLLVGKPVFEAETAMKLMMQHVTTAPVPPSQRTELPVPRDVETVVMACLEKDPDRRPSTADALSEALLKCSAARDWTPDRARRWWSVHLPAGAAS